ncbi:hypothetical protein ACHAXR_007520, partial [Thalassiosira sp. AJA248-18]
MNFIQPQRAQRQPSASPGRSSVSSTRGDRRKGSGSRSAADDGGKNGHTSRDDDEPLSSKIRPPAAHANEDIMDDHDNNREADPQLTMTQTDSNETNCSDPPLTNYDSPEDENDDAGSKSSEASHRARRRQLRELAAQSDDCWEANLSDDEKEEALPLQWNASMVRRKMMQQLGRKEDIGNNGGEGMNLYTRANSDSNNGIPITESLSSKESEGMSLPEQLLQKRLRRKQRLHEKHEQFVRYQQQKFHEQEENKCSTTPAHDNAPVTPSSSANHKPSINHLTGNNSEIRTGSPLFPDQEFDDDNASIVASSNGASNDYTHSRSTHKSHVRNEVSDKKCSASPLHSLPQRPICPFPDESDRKRIVGCLAAVLASSYAYETAPHLLVTEKKIGKGMPITEHIRRNNDVEQLVVPSGSSDEAVPENMSEYFDIPDTSTEGTSFDGSLHGRDMNGVIDIEGTQNQSAHDTISQPPLQQHKKQQHLIQQSRETQQRQPPSPFSFSAAFQKNKSFKDRSHSSSDIQPPKKSPPSSTNPMASFHHSFSFASFHNNNSAAARKLFDKPGSLNPPPSLTVELAEIRHRIRRHAILSELLISSAEMLMLDPSHAKAFLPMLENLLTKVELPTASDDAMDKSGHSVNSAAGGRQSWKGRGFGGGGVPDFCDDENATLPTQEASSMVHSPSSRTSQTKEVAPALQSSLPANERPNKSSNDTALHSVSEKPHEHGEYPSNPIQVPLDFDTPNTRDIYEQFSSSRIHSSFTEKQSSRSTSSSTPPPYAPLDTVIVERDLVSPFLQTLTPGAGFRCIALLLLNHLLRDGRGYDARVRQAFKRLAVVVISHELKVGGILRVDLDDEEGLDALLWGDGMTQQEKPSHEEESFDDADELARLATRKFEAMEHAIAAKLISMSGNARPKQATASKNTAGTRTTETRRNRQKQSSRAKKMQPTASSPSSSTHGRIALAPKETPLSSQHGISKEQLLRGIKVGTAGAVGATLFALTGGLAAPGIAAGLAAVAGTSAIAAGVSTVLSSAAAISTIFGVGGAGLASYKMHRRTKGLTEFDFHKEGRMDTEAELFSTVCISGWLRDARDFQRPWGVSPSHPRIIDKQELLERFYFIHNPSNVFRVGEILKHWKGRYFQLWRALREKYGRDPSNLFPLEEGPRIIAELTHEEGEAVDFLLDELGYFPKNNNSTKSPSFGGKPNDSGQDDSKGMSVRSPSSESKKLQSAQKQLKDSSLKPKKWLPESFNVNSSDIASPLSLFSETETNSINDNSTHTVGSLPNAPNKITKPVAEANKNPPKHLLTVWDYNANYGGELYTVQWESELLMELCDSVTDQMIEWGISATKTILHTTVFATLMTAVTLPYSLVLAANAIDSSWTMAMERADRAGVELAKSLIDSTAGHRPVILAGFSMGARVIYSCLKELAKHQEIWEAHQQKKQLPATRRKNNTQEEARGEDKLKYIREPASIVEDAILMGTPNHVSLKSWEACRRVVAGRIINCYSRKDLILSLMFQMKRFQGILRPVCGTSP